MIEGVKVKQLRIIPDERGSLLEILRSDDETFEKFGQVYLSTVYPGVIKAWHYHKKQTDNVACIKGMIKVVLYDNRKDSPTKGEVNELFIGDRNRVLIQIPKFIYHGWKCIGESEALVINCPTQVYNYKKPDEYRLPFNTKDIPYNWDIKMG
ncbi:MAG: dTDP-4-dehydrorhamnose 3,5-epimerase [Armatimonadetes bacterium CG07_land_8_20_14_0_80_40_9]|nr:MAG: dTDP-4-dehydrorhamnose 3,5-epimerase [Armatimonadetes bacterium CG07_land_8_20_14_0_80_40_9]